MAENINPINSPEANQVYFYAPKGRGTGAVPVSQALGNEPVRNLSNENEFVLLSMEDDSEPVLPPDEADFSTLDPEPVLPPEDGIQVTLLDMEPVLPPEEDVNLLTNGTQEPAPAKFSLEDGTVSQTMIDFLKEKENFKANAYKCPSGQWTIGYGHTKGVKPGQTVTKEQAEALLREDLADFEKTVKDAAKEAGVELTQGQYDALVSFTYNCGKGALKKAGLIEFLKKGDIEGAANKMKQYVKGGGKVLPGLVSRRETETSWLYT